MHREDVRFTSGGLVCAGWLYRTHHEGRRPAVVMTHRLAGIKEMRLDAYAERFCEAGYHVLVFDYRHLGESQGEPRQLLHIGRQCQDWAAAVEFARDQPEVDEARPHVDGLTSTLALGPQQAARLAGHALLDVANAVLRRRPHYIPASGAPGSRALMTSPRLRATWSWSRPGIRSISGSPRDSRCASVFTPPAGPFAPWTCRSSSRSAPRTPDPAIKAARRNPQATLSTYDTGHFQPYTGELFESFVADQIAFLNKALA